MPEWECCPFQSSDGWQWSDPPGPTDEWGTDLPLCCIHCRYVVKATAFRRVLDNVRLQRPPFPDRRHSGLCPLVSQFGINCRNLGGSDTVVTRCRDKERRQTRP